MGDIARLEAVALKVKKEVDEGHHVAVVVSAMAGVTNQLVGYVKSLDGDTLSSEYDAVVSSGEQITSGLLALALQQLGIPARSFMGWQIPIYTSSTHGNATIDHVETKHVQECWESGIVPVISGFQGITRDHRITTLGRGGSDTTAVAIAAALKADRCDIYTDVSGVFTADPRLVPLAQQLMEISYEEMLDLSAHGAKVLHAPCVELAQQHQVPLCVLSSFEDKPGTSVTPKTREKESRITGIAHSGGWVYMTLFSHHPLDFQAQKLSYFFQKEMIPVDMNLSYLRGATGSVGMLIPQVNLTVLLAFLDENRDVFDFFDIKVESMLAKISIIGINLIDKSGFSEQLLKMSNQKEKLMTMVSLMSHKCTLCVLESQAPDVVRSLHHILGLDDQRFDQIDINDVKRVKKL